MRRLLRAVQHVQFLTIRKQESDYGYCRKSSDCNRRGIGPRPRHGQAYVAKGAKVAIFDMNEANANEVIAELGADKVAFWKVNVADEASVKAAVEGVVEKFGALHICNNFAGIGNACKTMARTACSPWTCTCW